MKNEYDLGEIVYIYIGGVNNVLHPSKIIHKFKHNDNLLYVLEVETYIEPIYEVRDWQTISETLEGPINFVINMMH